MTISSAPGAGAAFSAQSPEPGRERAEPSRGNTSRYSGHGVKGRKGMGEEIETVSYL